MYWHILEKIEYHHIIILEAAGADILLDLICIDIRQHPKSSYLEASLALCTLAKANYN